MLKNRLKFKRSSYLPVASIIITLAIFALLFMQYRSIRHAQDQREATLKANLQLRLFEISEDAKREILDHANHIMHSFRQNRIRERNIPIIERILTTLTNRYPEIDDFYIVFFEPDLENETCQALKFVRPELKSIENAENSDEIPAGKMVKDNQSSESLQRTWSSIKKTNQTTIYTAFDPQSSDKFEQYFFHTVYENSLTKQNNTRKLVGLLVFKAKPENFPSTDFYENLVKKHQSRLKSMDGLPQNLNYKISLIEGENKRDLISTNDSVNTVLTQHFEESDRLFPNIRFGVSVPETKKSFADDYFQSNIILGVVAAVIALVGLFMTWRATRSEMRIARLKSDFLANISHELKTPLTSIRAFGELIHSGRSRNSARIREYGGIIKTESDRLTQIINDILEMSRLEKGIRRFHLTECDLRETVKHTVELFRHSTRAEGFEIDIKTPFVPVLAECDEGAIKQAVVNLLSNAAKYSNRDVSSRIEVSLTANKTDAYIKVRDFGMGISETEQKEIFIPFHRSTHDNVQARRGTGLGLAITHEIVKGHEGEIIVESKIGKGSTFIIRLPVLRKEELKKAAAETLEAGNNGTYLGHRG